MGVRSVLCICPMCVQYPWKSEESTGSPADGVTDNCKPSLKCCESNSGLQKKS